MLERLDAFREEAELRTPVPAFEVIEQRGRSRRRRRQTVIGAFAASVIATTGFAFVAHDDAASPQPAKDPDDSSLVTPYPGNLGTSLDKGTYEFELADPSLPTVRFTLPEGWSSWIGPNLFEGSRDDGVGAHDPDWYLSLLILDVQSIARRGCRTSDLDGADPAAVVRALTEAADVRVTSGPHRIVRFGRPATHLRLEEQRRSPECLHDVLLFGAEGAGISYLGRGTTYDAWVAEVDDQPLLVWASWTRGTPQAEVDGLLRIVDSIQVVDPK